MARGEEDHLHHRGRGRGETRLAGRVQRSTVTAQVEVVQEEEAALGPPDPQLPRPPLHILLAVDLDDLIRDGRVETRGREGVSDGDPRPRHVALQQVLGR